MLYLNIGLTEPNLKTVMCSVPYMQGDVQMSVSALLVLGDKANGFISDQIMEQWFASYIGKCKTLLIIRGTV